MSLNQPNAIASNVAETVSLTVGDKHLSCLQGRYELRQQLSAKPGKHTFLAWDTKQNRSVVVKVLLFGSDFEWCDLKLFEREAQILQALEHPSIPKYLDYFELDEAAIQGFVLVQTYIAAPTLEQLIQQGRRFSEVELIELSDQLLQLLDYLHGQMPVVIHRDIKPSNILLEPAKGGGDERSRSGLGTVHLIDFGSVQASASGTPGTITIVGSHGYIPLEQFGGQAVPASDLYSLGMTMLYLASGTHPSEMALAKNGSVKIELPQVSISYQQWLKKTIHPHLTHRYASANEAQLALFHRAKIASLNVPTRQPKSGFAVVEQGERIVIELLVNGRNTKPVYVQVGTTLFWIVWMSLTMGPILVGLLLVAFSIPVLNFCTLLSIFYFIYSCFSDWRNKLKKRIKYLSIDQEKISAYSTKDSWIKQNPSRHNRRIEILSLIYRPSYALNECFDSNGNRMRSIKGSTMAELSIYTDLDQYQIIGLQVNEFWELGQLISNYLDIELQVVYPMPQIPKSEK